MSAPNSQNAKLADTIGELLAAAPGPHFITVNRALAVDIMNALRAQQAGPADAVTPAMLQEACDIGLAVAGSLATDGDGAWLQRNEARLRELEQIARRSATPEGGKHG